MQRMFGQSPGWKAKSSPAIHDLEEQVNRHRRWNVEKWNLQKKVFLLICVGTFFCLMSFALQKRRENIAAVSMKALDSLNIQIVNLADDLLFSVLEDDVEEDDEGEVVRITRKNIYTKDELASVLKRHEAAAEQSLRAGYRTTEPAHA